MRTLWSLLCVNTPPYDEGGAPVFLLLVPSDINCFSSCQNKTQKTQKEPTNKEKGDETVGKFILPYLCSSVS